MGLDKKSLRQIREKADELPEYLTTNRATKEKIDRIFNGDATYCADRIVGTTTPVFRQVFELLFEISFFSPSQLSAIAEAIRGKIERDGIPINIEKKPLLALFLRQNIGSARSKINSLLRK